MSRIIIKGSATDLTVLEALTPTDLFAPSGTEPVFEAIKKEVALFIPDISTVQGRKEVSALAYKIAQSKNFLHKVGKTFNADLKEKTKAVDAERKAIWDKLEALQEEVRAPLTKWEADEEARVQGHKKALQDMDDLAGAAYTAYATVDEIIKAIAYVTADFTNRQWEEFADVAAERINHHKESLTVRLEKAKTAAKEKEELEQLRAAKAEQDVKDAAAAAQKAADEERVRVEAEAKKKADDAAAAAIAAAKAAEQKAKDDAAAAQAAADARAIAAAEAAEKRIKDAEVAKIAAEAKAKLEADAAVEAERKRAADAKKKEDDAAKARENDRAHHAKINNEAATAIKRVIAAVKADEEVEKFIVTAIARGDIPNVKISY